MHRFALPILGAGAALFAAQPSLAAEIAVEEFGAMTRVTIPVVSQSGWIIRKADRSIHLTANGTGDAVTSPMLAGEGRLSNVEVWKGASETGISIHFSCDCRSSHFYGEGGVVIVDVTDRSAPVPVPAAGATIVETPATPDWSPSRVRVDNRQPAAPARNTGEPRRVAEALSSTPSPRRKPQRKAAGPTVSEDAAIDALRDVVLEKLALGVEQGRITMDSVNGDGKPYIPAGCADEDALDLKRLTDSSDFREAIPTLRADVFDEMKQLNPAGVRALARHFIAFGLGEEARNVIEAFDTKGPPEKLILDMATVLKGLGETMTESVLLKPDCGPRAAVWRAAVAAEKGDGNVRKIYEKARNAIFEMPDPLRKILGARVALGLIDEGDRESAMRLWRNLQVATGPITPEMRLLAAYAYDGHELDNLLALSETRSLAANEAARRAAAILLKKTDRSQAERLRATLEDLSFIHRETPEETPVSLALARLQSRYGDLASALTVLAEKAEDHPERADHWRSIAHETIRVATEAADPVARPHDLDTILASLKYLDNSPSSDAAKFSLSRKLMDVGGAHIVESVLNPDILRRSAEARRLVAEAKLLTGDATGAQQLLDGLNDENSAALKKRTAIIIGADTAISARALFGSVEERTDAASIATARDLMDEAEADLSIIEELLIDG